jgi:hypothetical protein
MDSDFSMLERKLEDAYDRIAAMESERDTVAGMTIAVYVLFSIGAGLIGFVLRGFVGW